ncbi:MAG: carboxylating nicotinate-nucleotide diphosphorylase [Clostridiales bacterium]
MLQTDKIDKIIKIALEEDISSYDITTENVFKNSDYSIATIIAKEDGILAGIEVFKRVFYILDNKIEFKQYYDDGDTIKDGNLIIELSGSTINLLKGERTALNLLQRLCGIATLTNKYCRKVKDYNVKVTDTRKTTPGLRHIEKYAVKVGGGANHRYNLSDGVLIKDNHIKACNGIKNAVEKIRGNIPHTIKIEVETENLDDVKEAIEAKADIIMLDNMKYEEMSKAVELIKKSVLIEASGNVDFDNIENYAKTGVDIISVGKLTHSFKSMDISMKIK